MGERKYEGILATREVGYDNYQFSEDALKSILTNSPGKFIVKELERFKPIGKIKSAKLTEDGSIKAEFTIDEHTAQKIEAHGYFQYMGMGVIIKKAITHQSGVKEVVECQIQCVSLDNFPIDPKQTPIKAISDEDNIA